jgi:serine phosphatase RsbU (regulator of sigma subunit)/tetratricopeptide (TPR) repeat protein
VGYRFSKLFNIFFSGLCVLGLWGGRVLLAQANPDEISEAQVLLQKLDTAKGSSKVSILNKLFIATYYSDPMRSFNFLTEAVSLAREVKDDKGQANSHNNLGVFFLDRANYASALEQFMEAQRIREKIKDSAGLGDSYINIGLLYQYQELYPKAIETYQKALAIYTGLADSLSLGYICNNLGNAYMANQSLDSARKYLEVALLYKASDAYSLPSTYDNLGELYLKQNDLKQAAYFFDQALSIREKTENLMGIAESMMRLGNMACEKGNSTKAIELGKKGFELAEKVGNTEMLPEAARLISRAYYKSGKAKEAYLWLEKYLELKDSLFSTEILTRIAGLEAAGKIQNQRTEIELLKSQKDLAQAESDRRRALAWAFFIGMLLLVLIAILYYSRYRTKKKANATLQARNIEIEEKNVVIGRQHQLITDSIRYARNIQESFLPSSQMPPLSGGEMFIINQPRDIVSGDFYWMDFVQGKLIFALADGTGHGVPGAFISLIGITLIKTSLKELPDASPDLRLTWLHEEVVRALGNQGHQEDFSEGMDIALITYDPRTKILEFAGAQRPLVFFHEGEMEMVRGDRISIGDKRIPEPVFMLHTRQVSDGDTVYLFTDGLTDLLGGPKRRRITTPVFLSWLKEVNLLPEDLRASELKHRIQTWRQDSPQADDILLAGIEFRY